MPDTHYVPSLSSISKAMTTHRAQNLKAMPMSTEGCPHTTTQSAGESPQSVLRRALLGTVAPYADELARRNRLDKEIENTHGVESDETYTACCALNSEHRARAQDTPILSLADVAAGMAELLRLLESEHDGEDCQHLRYRFDFLKRGRELLDQVQEAAAINATHTSVIPSLAMTFRQAADRVQELLNWNGDSAERDPSDDGPEEVQRDANCCEWIRIEAAMREAPAATLGDVLAKLERLACPILGAGAFEITPEDINPIIDDIYRMVFVTPQVGELAESEAFAKFRAWVEASKLCDDLRHAPDDDPAYNAAVDALSAASRAVAKAPARSAFDLAAKVYILWQCEYGDTSAGAASIALPTPDMSDDTEDGTLILGLIGDALRMFPALQILATGDATAALASLSAAPALDAGIADAELLAAFEEWKRESIAAETQPTDTFTTHDAAVDRAADLIEMLPALTLAGALVKLRFLFARRGEGPEHYDAVLRDMGLSEKAFSDYRDRMVWRLIRDLERIAAASPSIAQPDTFADTVAAFEAEAPGMLSVPQIPTQAMEQAATQLAGITPEQFRYAYAAALEAFKGERAA